MAFAKDITALGGGNKASSGSTLPKRKPSYAQKMAQKTWNEKVANGTAGKSPAEVKAAQQATAQRDAIEAGRAAAATAARRDVAVQRATAQRDDNEAGRAAAVQALRQNAGVTTAPLGTVGNDRGRDYDSAPASYMPAYQQTAGSPSFVQGYQAQEIPVMSYEDFAAKMGAGDYMDQVKASIAAQVEQARKAYEAQIEKTNQDAEETARQAYVANRLGQQHLDQRLAASGLYGGMADSQRLAAEANYQNNLAEIDRQRTAAIDELRQAIEKAELLGDQQSAEALKEYLSALQSQYNNYWQTAQSQFRQAYLNGDGAVSTGGYSSAASAATPTREQIRQMQAALGVAQDGIWGPISSAAANGLSAAEAWQMYQQAYGA